MRGKKVSAFLHVSGEPLPQGEPLKPQWLKQACDIYFPVAEHSLGNGPDAVRQLLQQAHDDPLQAPGIEVLRTVLIEFMFERVRRQEFPACPRRTEAVFMFTSERSVRRYIAEYKTEPGLVYSCEVESGDRFLGDMALINRLRIKLSRDLAGQLARIQETARLYWRSGDPASMDWPEVLATGRVVVRAPVLLN